MGIYKNSRQEEFCGLMDRMEEAGFKASDVASMLDISRGAVSKILSGERSPRPMTLELFRRIVSETLGGEAPPSGRTRETMELHDQLAALKEHDPAGYEAARITIRTLHRKIAEVQHTPDAASPAAGEPKASSSKTQEAAREFVGKRIRAIRSGKAAEDPK